MYDIKWVKGLDYGIELFEWCKNRLGNYNM